MQLSIIIVNYNVKYYLEHCLLSVIAACKTITAEIIVIDNASTDGSKAYFLNRFNTVQFVWKTTNDGFSKANNQGLQLANGDVVLFLNPDTIVPEDCFIKCLNFFNTDKLMGAVGVKMVDGSGRYLPESKRGFPNPFTAFCKLFGLTFLFPTSKIFAKYYMGYLPNNTNNPVDVIAGACMFVRKKVLDVVGSFDPSFFMYGEDIDLSYRIKKAGYNNYFFAHTTIIHFKGESTQKLHSKYIQYFYGAMKLFVKKHYKGGTSIVFNGLLQLAITVKTLQAFIHTFLKKQIVVAQPQTLTAGTIEVVSNDVVLKNITPIFKHQPNILLKKSIAANNNCIDSVLFSSSKMPFTAIISCIEQPHYYKHILFHAEGALSIIGSGNKNKNGIAFAYK